MAPPRNATKSGWGPRMYVWPPPPAEATHEVPSVTSILGVEAKPGVEQWKLNVTGEEVVGMTRSGALKALVDQDPQLAINAIKNAWRSHLDKAGNTGTLVHEYLEAQIKGRDRPDLTPEAEQIVGHAQKLLHLYDVEPLYSECTVYGGLDDIDTVGYAGTLDLIVEMFVPGRGRKRLVVDWKTSKGIYPNMAAQCAAYRFADKLVTGDDGTVIEMPETDGAVIFHIRPEGALAVPVAADENAWDYFMAARRLWGATHNKGWRAVYPPLPEIKAA
jgi:hypothetical protein